MERQQLVHGGDLTTYSKRYPGQPVLDFSANINPLGLPAGVRDALAGCGEACTHYPDPLCRELTHAIAGFEGVPPEWVLCGNGASDLIWRIAWANHSGRALVPAPTFADYERALAAAGCAVRVHPLSEEAGFAADEGILDAIRGVDLVFLCTPNNPTGARIAPGLLERILRRCAETGAVLAVDECFLDFEADGEAYSMKRFLPHADNLIVLRAFTKLFAMPGVRLGYLLTANPVLLARLETMGPTWAVSAPAQLCGVAATGETAYLAETRRRLPGWRDQLARGLARLGCRVYPSHANYLFFRARPSLAEELQPRGILLRDCANYEGLGPGCYRTAVRTGAENDQLLKALGEVLHG